MTLRATILATLVLAAMPAVAQVQYPDVRQHIVDGSTQVTQVCDQEVAVSSPQCIPFAASDNVNHTFTALPSFLAGVAPALAVTNVWTASQTFSAGATSVTPATSDNSTAIATTAYVQAQGYIGGSTPFVSSVAGRTGAVTLTAGDVSGLAASATTDATNASNITSGTLAGARLPNPAASALGGVLSASAGSNQFQTGISTAGAPTFAQPTAGNISGLATSATTDTTNASNISSGTLAGARLPAPTSSVLGGVLSATAGTNQFQTGVSTSGAPTFAQPSASNISGLAASATTDTTNAANISTGTLAAGRLPALTGDVTTTAGTVATTVTKTGGVAFGGLATLSAAPAGTLTGTALNSTVVTSSLTSVGTIATGTWTATAIGTAHGGTGVLTGLTVLPASGLTGSVAVANGGTGQTAAGKTAANAIGAAESGANSSITSLTGLTTPLSSALGGFVGTATAYAPTITCTGGTACTVGSVTAASSINGKWLFLHVSGTVTFTVTGTLINIPLPSGACSGNNSYSGVDSNNLGGGAVAGICAAGATTITASLVGVTSGDVLAFNGVIQLQ